MLEQPAHGCGVLGVHQTQQRLGFGIGELAEEVGGIIGIHGFENVGTTIDTEVVHHLDLVVVGEFLDDIGQAFVIERERDLHSPLDRQFAHCVGHVGGAQILELHQQLRDALPGHRQGRLRQSLHVLPVDDMDGSATSEPGALTPHCDAGDEPIAGADEFDPEIDHDRVHVVQFLEFRIVHADLGIEDLGEDENLVRPLRESAQTHVSGVQLNRVRFDARHAQHRHENSSARGKLDDETEDARLRASHPHGDHQVTDTADGLAVGTEDDQTCEPGRVKLAQSCHDGKVRASRDHSENRTDEKNRRSDRTV